MKKNMCRIDVSGIFGDASGIWGDIEDCEITQAERDAGINILDLISEK